MMKNRLHRGISALMACILIGQSMPAALAVSEAGTRDNAIEITEAVFPDPAFRSWLQNASNINGYGADGLLTAEEISNILSIDVSGKNMQSLQGIEVFTSLEKLDCKK